MEATKIEIDKLTKWLNIDYWGNYYYIPIGGFKADGVKKWLHTREGSMHILEAFWRDNVDFISIIRTGWVGKPEKELIHVGVDVLYGSSRTSTFVKKMRDVWQALGGGQWNWLPVAQAEAKTLSSAIYKAAINYLEEGDEI